jgi:hypothetical protein
MKASEFKTGIKAIKENLRGLTLQLITKNSVTPYDSIREFGQAVLSEEEKGNAFSINQVWTPSGIIKVKSLSDLAGLLITRSVTAIQFESYRDYSDKDFAFYLKHSFGTTE